MPSGFADAADCDAAGCFPSPNTTSHQPGSHHAETSYHEVSAASECLVCCKYKHRVESCILLLRCMMRLTLRLAGAVLGPPPWQQQCTPASSNSPPLRLLLPPPLAPVRPARPPCCCCRCCRRAGESAAALHLSRACSACCTAAAATAGHASGSKACCPAACSQTTHSTMNMLDATCVFNNHQQTELYCTAHGTSDVAWLKDRSMQPGHCVTPLVSSLPHRPSPYD
mgnify:CR=1 FL=1